MLSSLSEQPLQLFEPVEDDVQLPLSQDRCLVVDAVNTKRSPSGAI